MMYKCEKCVRLMQDFEVGKKSSYVGEFWGTDAYESLSCCPNCGCDDIGEVFECSQCGEWFYKEELESGFCDNCLHQATPQDCFEVSKEFEEKKIVKLNSFIVEMFTEEEMEDILLEALMKCGADTSKYVDGDTEWFAENLKELKGGEKMKTPKSNRDEVRETTFTVTVTRLEKEAIQKEANKVGLTMSSWVRMIVTEKINHK